MGTFIGLADDSTDLQQSLQSYLDHYHQLDDPVIESCRLLVSQLDDVIDAAVAKAARVGFNETTAW